MIFMIIIIILDAASSFSAQPPTLLGARVGAAVERPDT
jgi:hypothetical protein